MSEEARQIRYAATCFESRIGEAIAKHGMERTPLNPDMDPLEKLAVLVEEVGEVAKELTYDHGNPDNLRKELEQVGAVITMWRASL